MKDPVKTKAQLAAGIQPRVRELAWTGQHAQAIDLATQALAAAKRKPAEQMDLLDLRAESYIALGQLDLAAQDAQAMVKLANAEKKAALKAQALNRQALVQMRTGELQAAIKTGASALKAARTSRQKLLEAESLLRLSEAQTRTRADEKAVQTAAQAADLFAVLGNPSGQGRALWIVALPAVCQKRLSESTAASARG
jgi:tetratricopeptide (TPR) repeat protein